MEAKGGRAANAEGGVDVCAWQKGPHGASITRHIACVVGDGRSAHCKLSRVGPRADSTHASTTRLWATKRISLAERIYPAPVAYGNGNTAPSVSHAGKKPFVPGVPKVLPKLESAACKFQPNAQRSARTPVRNAAGTMPAKLMAPTRANLRHRRELRRGSCGVGERARLSCEGDEAGWG